MAFWRKKRLLSETEGDWIAERFADFIARFGTDWFDEGTLVLPTREFFDAPKGADPETANIVFEQIKQHMGLGPNWAVRLEVQEAAKKSQAVSDTVLIQHDQGQILGSFRVDEVGPLITYDPDLPKTPKAFISTMAHELAHFMMAAIPSESEQADDPMIDEMATDILVIAAGMGVLSLESVISSEAHQDAFSQGWSISRRGYISPEFVAFALALFLRLRDIPETTAMPHLAKPNKRRLTLALAQIDADPEILDIARGKD